jgi:hypothetical protein
MEDHSEWVGEDVRLVPRRQRDSCFLNLDNYATAAEMPRATGTGAHRTVGGRVQELGVGLAHLSEGGRK